MMFFKMSHKKSVFLIGLCLVCGMNLYAQADFETEEPSFVVIKSEEVSETVPEEVTVTAPDDLYVEMPVEEPVEVPEVPVDMPVAEPETTPVEVLEEPEPVTVEEQIETPVEVPEDTEVQEDVPATEDTQEQYEYQALAIIRYKNTDTISFRLKVSYIPKPYILAISLSAGFTEYKLLQPFYFGGFLEPHIGIPQKTFPYEYEINGSSLGGPLIIGGKLYAPFGICVFPFQENIEFFAEVAPGISLNMMWDAKFGNDSVTSKLYPAFYASLRTGVSYKGFSFFIEGNYDAILGFGVSAGFGYSINFDISPDVDRAPSLK